MTIFRTLAVLLVAVNNAKAQEAPTSVRDAVDAKALPDYTGKKNADALEPDQQCNKRDQGDFRFE